MITLRITPEQDGEGNVFLLVTDGASTDRVGPLRAGEEVVVVLEPPNPGAGARPPTNRMKKLANKQERRMAETIGGRVQPGSGSSSRAKGDVRKLGEWRGEMKFTYAHAYKLDVRTFFKIASECAGTERPFMGLAFNHKDSGRTHAELVVMAKTDFEELLKHAPSHHR